jgi:hypothetical protein
MTALWELQPNETPKSFAAFNIYLKLPPNERSLSRVVAALGHASNSTVEKWSSENDWVERARAYDAYIANSAIEVRKVGLTEAQLALTEQTSLALTAAFTVSMRELQRLGEQQNKGEAIDTKDLGRVVRAIADIDTLNRRNLGLPTAYKVETISEPDNKDAEYYIGGSDG